jgi:phosphohistidine phosphatase
MIAYGCAPLKTLHLLRHAKSSWKQPELADRDRGLNKRGRRDAPRMGEALAARVPAMIVHASPARRARLTLEGLCAGWPALRECPHICDERLYTFDVNDLLDWLSQQPDLEPARFIIGHNPALTDLVNRLAGQYRLENLPTAGYVELGLPIRRWRDLPSCEAVLEYSLFPKQLPAP